ncbi:MAG: pyridoxal phosphate-dependent aminotransferase, partial [Acidobacteria bacterium]|nr:pyridoxal phosphate-dependent aminotransferase [Acidobacteriota bacterium]
DSPGTPELRTAVAESYNDRYGTSLASANVIAGCGGKQELFNLMLALVDDGDEVIIPAPYWVSFPQQVELVGGTPVIVDLSLENGFRPTPELIEAAFTDRTKIVILNSPSNPTGALIERDALGKIIEICAKRGVVLIYDETYEYFVYDGNEHVSAAEWIGQYPDTVVIVNSMSKTYAMTGWRIGFAIADQPLVKAMSSIQSHSTSNPSSISQHAAIEGLTGSKESLEEMIDAYSMRRSWLVPQLSSLPGFSCEPPGGAFYVFPYVADLFGKGEITDSTSLSSFLLERARVAVVPGIAFGNDEHVRISYATSLEKLQEAVQRMRQALEEIW